MAVDPFLVCVHHRDRYPRGTAHLGPDASLEGRALGGDFSAKDGWSMYHGIAVPGFPAHPHRGFETITIVREGYVDHSDSLGGRARFGPGDVQWLTAGRGIVHSEMFALVHEDQPNPLDLLQIWLNLPADSKMQVPHFSMIWNEDLVWMAFTDADGRSTMVRAVAGSPPSPHRKTERPMQPSHSGASRPEADVAILQIKMQEHARWSLPPTMGERTRQMLYFFEGTSLCIAETPIRVGTAIELRGSSGTEIINGQGPAELLLLQGRPLGEPIAQYGPFVMNNHAQIQDALAEYQSTQFGGWPWSDRAPVHERGCGRFAHYPDGRLERR